MPRIMHKTKDSYDTKVFLFINNCNIFFQVKYHKLIKNRLSYLFKAYYSGQNTIDQLTMHELDSSNIVRSLHFCLSRYNLIFELWVGRIPILFIHMLGAKPMNPAFLFLLI